jgi:hypothetical protein
LGGNREIAVLGELCGGRSEIWQEEETNELHGGLGKCCGFGKAGTGS